MQHHHRNDSRRGQEEQQQSEFLDEHYHARLPSPTSALLSLPSPTRPSSSKSNSSSIQPITIANPYHDDPPFDEKQDHHLHHPRPMAVSETTAISTGLNVQPTYLSVSPSPSPPPAPGTTTSTTTTKNPDSSDGVFSKLTSITLENTGSVARDHLALERTFLAWLRTSLAFASIGIAVTQLFRLNTSISGTAGAASEQVRSRESLKHVGKPLGATFLGIAVLVLVLGVMRYYESQQWLLKGKFPASRGSVMLITGVAVMLIVASFVVILVVAPEQFEP